MKVCIVLLLAAVALTAIASAINAHTSHKIELPKEVQDAQALVEGQLGWISDTDNQLSGIR